ncbi:MAG: hypothetical protein Q7T24_05860 [Deltaproteobacteria bacterium]|nr:hypothetical protein [Deltaproteobacteria bacterium]
MDRLADKIAEHLRVFYGKVTGFIPDFLVMLIIVAIGFILASLVKFLLHRVFKAVKFDSWSDEVGLTSAFRISGIRTPPGDFIRLFIYWLLILMFFMAGLTSLRLETVNTLTSLFFLYLPRFFSALLILIFGYFFAGFIARAALLAGVNAGVQYSRLIAASVRLILLILIAAMALEQLSIAPRIVFAAFSIAFGAIALALAIAFGLGARDSARELIEYLIKKRREKDNITLL